MHDCWFDCFGLCIGCFAYFELLIWFETFAGLFLFWLFLTVCVWLLDLLFDNCLVFWFTDTSCFRLCCIAPLLFDSDVAWITFCDFILCYCICGLFLLILLVLLCFWWVFRFMFVFLLFWVLTLRLVGFDLCCMTFVVCLLFLLLDFVWCFLCFVCLWVVLII